MIKKYPINVNDLGQKRSYDEWHRARSEFFDLEARQRKAYWNPDLDFEYWRFDGDCG